MHWAKQALLDEKNGSVDFCLANTGVFPNKKEWSEAAGMLDAAKNFSTFSFSDKNVLCVCVGDGQTPRCGAMFAWNTSWNVHSVDPKMRKNEQARLSRLNIPKLKNLSVFHQTFQEHMVPKFDRCIIVACHAHVDVHEVYQHYARGKKTKNSSVQICAMPCCVPQNEICGIKPFTQFDSDIVQSPAKTVKIWRF